MLNHAKCHAASTVMNMENGRARVHIDRHEHAERPLRDDFQPVFHDN